MGVKSAEPRLKKCQHVNLPRRIDKEERRYDADPDDVAPDHDRPRPEALADMPRPRRAKHDHDDTNRQRVAEHLRGRGPDQRMS